jgi:hypothetical protein
MKLPSQPAGQERRILRDAGSLRLWRARSNAPDSRGIHQADRSIKYLAPPSSGLSRACDAIAHFLSLLLGGSMNKNHAQRWLACTACLLATFGTQAQTTSGMNGGSVLGNGSSGPQTPSNGPINPPLPRPSRRPLICPTPARRPTQEAVAQRDLVGPTQTAPAHRIATIQARTSLTRSNC